MLRNVTTPFELKNTIEEIKNLATRYFSKHKLPTMKNITKSFARTFLLIGLLSFLVSAASNPKPEKLVFKTSSVCKTCKSAIEETLSKVDGVLVSLVNLSSHKVSVKYNPELTNTNKIKEAVLKSGYAFNNEQPAKEDYAKLPACCKKDANAACAHP